MGLQEKKEKNVKHIGKLIRKIPKGHSSQSWKAETHEWEGKCEGDFQTGDGGTCLQHLKLIFPIVFALHFSTWVVQLILTFLLLITPW